MEISIRLFRQADGGRVHQVDGKEETFFLSVDGGFTKDENKKAALIEYLQSEITVDGLEAGGEFPVLEESLIPNNFSFSALAHTMAARYIAENKIDPATIQDLTINFSVNFK